MASSRKPPELLEGATHHGVTSSRKPELLEMSRQAWRDEQQETPSCSRGVTKHDVTSSASRKRAPPPPCTR